MQYMIQGRAAVAPGLKRMLGRRGTGVLTLLIAAALAGCTIRERAPQPGSEAQYTLPQQVVDSPYGQFLAARHARQVQDHAAAARFYTRALAAEPDNLTLMQGAFTSLLGDGRVADAMLLAPELRATNPGDHLARLTIASGMMLRRDFDAALALVAEGPQNGIHGAFNPLILAWAHAGKGDAVNAKVALARLERNPLFGAVHDHLKPLLLESVGLDDEAIATYKALAERPERVGTRQTDAYIRLLLRHGRTAEATEVLDRQLALNPENVLLLATKARMGSARNGVQGVAVMNAVDGFAETLFAAANVFGRNDGGELAEMHLQLALSLRPDLDDARISLADIYESRKQWQRAIETYGQIRADSPYINLAQNRIAWATFELGDRSEAVRMLRRYARERPQDPRPLLTLADLYRQAEMWPDAAKEYTAALERIPKIETRHWATLFGRGIAYERSKQWDKAEKDMEHALQLQPEQPMVLNYLGYTWVDMGRNLERATAMIKRATELRPNDGAIIDSLGWAYYRQGRYAEAVTQLERAVELKASDPVITDHLGDSYWQVGRRAEAEFQWRRALGLKPESELEAQIRLKLQHGLQPSAAK